MRYPFFLFLFLNLTGYSQLSSIKIQVLDEGSRMPISYAGYVRISDNKGSFANEEGFFTIDSKLEEQYLLTCVGYIPDTIIPIKTDKVIYLKPSYTQLKSVVVMGKKIKENTFQIGKLGGFSLVPYHASISRKMEICTYIPSLNNEKKWEVKSIKMDIGGSKSKVYTSFLIRLFIKDVEGGLPGKDLLNKNMVVTIKSNSFGYEFMIEEKIILPKKGCFVGFETVGKIDKADNFIPFTDFYQKPEKPFEFDVRMVKSDAYSLFRLGGFDSWFNNKDSSGKPDTYAIALEVLEAE